MEPVIENLMDTQETDEVSFDYDWLSRTDYQFKLLALLAVLANNQLAYRGTLTDMCEFLGVGLSRSKDGTLKNNSRVNKKIREAIDSLEKDGLLKKVIDDHIFTLTLSKKAEKQRRVIKIQREWVMVAKNYAKMPNKSVSVGWEPLLKVWLFLLDRGKSTAPITNRAIAEALNLSEGTVKHARAALTNDIEAIISKRKTVFDPEKPNLFQCVGCEITVSAIITDVRPVR